MNIMHSATPGHNVFKNVVMTAWKERWNEQKWTTTMKSLLQSGSTSDMLQMADVLFSQAFVGNTPNTVLLGYFNYGLKSGTFSYAAIFTAISKHEDLQNVTNMMCTLKFLMMYIDKLNKGQILEESMTLCKSLLLILKWLLCNIEQYLNGMNDVSNEDANDIIKSNCSALLSLTTSRRTAALLTIARFEESSVWSHIETDLAVIKGAAINHSAQNEVSLSCNSVSQLARCHVKTSPIYPKQKVFGTESHHSMLVNMRILQEVEWNKMTDRDTLMQQILLIGQLCDLSSKDVCLDVIRACMLGFLGNFDGIMKHKWSAVLFLVLPDYLLCLKSHLFDNGNLEVIVRHDHSDFESALYHAFSDILEYDSLLDMLDQVTTNVDCFYWLVDRCFSFNLLKETSAEQLKVRRKSMPKSTSQHPSQVTDPAKMVKYEAAASNFLALLDPDHSSNQEAVLSTISQVSCNFSIILASAVKNLQNVAQKIIAFNDIVKSNPKQGENVKGAQVRCLQFDFTFFLACKIAEQYGKSITLSAFNDDASEKPFMWHWISHYWPDGRQSSSRSFERSQMKWDDKRVKVYIDLLQNVRERTQDQSPSLTKWQDMCINFTKAFLEMIVAWNFKYVTKADVLGACDIICRTLSLAVRLSCLIEAAKFSLSASNEFNSDLKEVIRKLLSKPASTGQDLHIENRYGLFRSTAEYLLKDTIPTIICPTAANVSGTSTPRYPSDRFNTLITECRQSGWISGPLLQQLTKLFDLTGPKWFVRQLTSYLLKQTRKDVVDRVAMVMAGLVQLDLESCIICLLRQEIPNYLLDSQDHMMLSAPAGSALSKLTVSCLAIVLHNLSLRQKGCLPPKSSREKSVHERLVSGIEAPIAHQRQAQEEAGPSKLRRIFSVTAEHDLASGAFSSILGEAQSDHASQSRSARVTEQPVLKALSYALDIMHTSLEQHQPGPHVDFIVQFVYLASCCGELVSQAVLQFMPLSMVSELVALTAGESSSFKVKKLDEAFDSLQFSLRISDLGHSISRKVAAKTICQTMLDKSMR